MNRVRVICISFLFITEVYSVPSWTFCSPWMVPRVRHKLSMPTVFDACQSEGPIPSAAKKKLERGLRRSAQMIRAHPYPKGSWAPGETVLSSQDGCNDKELWTMMKV